MELMMFLKMFDLILLSLLFLNLLLLKEKYNVFLYLVIFIKYLIYCMLFDMLIIFFIKLNFIFF